VPRIRTASRTAAATNTPPAPHWITSAVRGRERADAEAPGKPSGLAVEQAASLARDRYHEDAGYGAGCFAIEDVR
jgi:hypothetical protein